MWELSSIEHRNKYITNYYVYFIILLLLKLFILDKTLDLQLPFNIRNTLIQYLGWTTFDENIVFKNVNVYVKFL